MMRRPGYAVVLAVIAFANLGGGRVQGADPWLILNGYDGPGKGKHIVLISGDEEYRSEEALPQLAKILAKRHGFKCTVLFAINPKDGTINPNQSDNIPGLEALKTADLMVIFTRYRDLPDEQMKYIVDYVQSGKPIIGMRTATHAFNIKAGKTYEKYSAGSKEWDGGFGRQVLGETWISHHGHHGQQSTRGIIAPGAENHPILRGIKDGDIWRADRRLWRPAPHARRLQAARAGSSSRRNEADCSAHHRQAKRPDDAGRMGQDLYRRSRPSRSRFRDDHGCLARPPERRAPPTAGECLLLGSGHRGQDLADRECRYRR